MILQQEKIKQYVTMSKNQKIVDDFRFFKIA